MKYLCIVLNVQNTLRSSASSLSSAYSLSLFIKEPRHYKVKVIIIKYILKYFEYLKHVVKLELP